MTVRTASCSCGQLGYRVEGEPRRVVICHCLECQKRTGSAFGLQANFAREQVAHISGEAKKFPRVGDAGTTITFHFCPNCGSSVLLEWSDDPDRIGVTVGSFAEPGFLPPVKSIYESRSHPWLKYAHHAEMERHD
jgi:hypothetical protein